MLFYSPKTTTENKPETTLQPTSVFYSYSNLLHFLLNEMMSPYTYVYQGILYPFICNDFT